MTTRRILSLVVGVLGVYLLVHAVMAGYALYLVHDVLQQQQPRDDLPYVAEMRENYVPFLSLFLVVSSLSGLTLSSCAGFIRKSTWAHNLWLATSVALVACVVVAVVAFGVVWTHYLFELGAVCVSSWYLLQLRREGYAG